MFAETLIAALGLLAIPAAQASASETMILRELPVAKYAAPNVLPPLKKDAEALGVETTARAAVVIDAASGDILYGKNARTAYPVASLTKIVTAMTFLDAKPDLDEEVALSAEDEAREGRSVFAKGERLTKRNLLRALLVGSVNAAGNTLARTSGGHEAFIREMNAKAKELRMRHARFYDPTGLDERNQASAQDMAIALRASLFYPEIREATGEQKIDIKGLATGHRYSIKTTNLLLGSFLNKAPYRIVAGKTGSLPEAGFCLAQATRDEDGNEVIAVVLGSENHFSRFADAKALTYWTFKNFAWPKKQAARDRGLFASK